MMSKSERLLKALSYSQKRCLVEADVLLGGRKQAILVMSTMAEEKGLTRSTIVNALRFAEVAGIVDCQSCGMKGTHVNIIDEQEWNNTVFEIKSKGGIV